MSGTTTDSPPHTINQTVFGERERLETECFCRCVTFRGKSICNKGVVEYEDHVTSIRIIDTLDHVILSMFIIQESAIILSL